MQDLQKKKLFKKFSVSPSFQFDTDKNKIEMMKIDNYLFLVEADLSYGFPRPLFILVRTENNEKSFTTISLLGIFPMNFHNMNIKKPIEIFRKIASELGSKDKIHNFEPYEAFKGTVGFDYQFTEYVTEKIAGLINTALKKVKVEVINTLERQKEYAMGTAKNVVRVSSQTILISKID